MDNNFFITENKNLTKANIGFFLKMPLTGHNLAMASLLAKMQVNSSQYFNTINKQTRALTDLYNMSFDVTPQLYGRELLLMYRLSYIEPLEVMDPEYSYEKIIETFSRIVRYPNLDSKVIKLAQNQLFNEYQELMASPTSYAWEHFFKKWYHDQPDFAHGIMGPINEILEADKEGLDAYSEALTTCPAAMIGNAKNSKYIIKLLKDAFSDYDFEAKFTSSNLVIETLPDPFTDEEKRNFEQAQMLLGFGYNGQLNKKERLAGKFLARYLAGDDSSILFRKIREQLGAAYAVDADNYVNNSLLLVSAGLSHDKLEQASKIAQEEIDNIKAGDIDQAIFKKIKKAIYNEHQYGLDRAGYRIMLKLRALLMPEYAFDDLGKSIRQMQIKDLIKLANKLTLNESFYIK
ncbi:insulinase family protein [Lactobacillus mulieris]|uniref:M16 family metallopeptidase n=1 Tax=Lactobacillus mulieris TaxID=2508708 RepID=UPI001F1EB73D|nr:insulinase family protein [Lactobacillus mulieris]MCF1783522.1 insulinase family protein [Lactobacillus mulieris]MCW8104108.1 insulinase family protein [Lactobacillus mulieris]MDK6802834.1 insulinase family protein [Lactobacillus mulieris]MDK8381950.1 insulinase family protein [Lactobacillus mulieris]MDT9620159.1 insulinase family protein [Lactobacillus mulieris]